MTIYFFGYKYFIGFKLLHLKYDDLVRAFILTMTLLMQECWRHSGRHYVASYSCRGAIVRLFSFAVNRIQFSYPRHGTDAGDENFPLWHICYYWVNFCTSLWPSYNVDRFGWWTTARATGSSKLHIKHRNSSISQCFCQSQDLLIKTQKLGINMILSQRFKPFDISN